MRYIREPKYIERKGNHAYDVEAVNKETKERVMFENVVAANRAQAASIVAYDGYIICSVNMVG